MLDKNKLLSAIEERIEEIINIDKLLYISNAPYGSVFSSNRKNILKILIKYI